MEPPVATGADREQNVTPGGREVLKQSSGLMLQMHRDDDEQLVSLFHSGSLSCIFVLVAQFGVPQNKVLPSRRSGGQFQKPSLPEASHVAFKNAKFAIPETQNPPGQSSAHGCPDEGVQLQMWPEHNKRGKNGTSKRLGCVWISHKICI